MTSQRAQAYGRVVNAVEDLAASKLHADEQQIIRDAADALFFCDDLAADPTVLDTVAAFHRLVDRLVESDRVLPETAGTLAADVEACGPLTPVG